MNHSDCGPILLIVAGVLLVLAVVAYSIAEADRELATARPPAAPTIEVHFSPRGGCTEALIKLIGSARRCVHVQAYSFTSRPIVAVLVAAHRRGVRVEILLDGDQRELPYSLGRECADSGIRVAYDSGHQIAHNKVTIVDGKAVATGSFNLTAGAESRNAENLVIIRDAATAAAYEANWAAHSEHSEP